MHESVEQPSSNLRPAHLCITGAGTLLCIFLVLIVAGCGDAAGTALPPQPTYTLAAVGRPTETAMVGPQDTATSLAIAQPTDTTLGQPTEIAIGGSQDTATVVVEPTNAPAVATPISRNAEFAYPKRMQANRPAVVRFSIFVPGSEPIPISDAATPSTQILVTPKAGLQPYISVDLEQNGARIVSKPDHPIQPLYGTANIWEWQIEGSENQAITLRPRIHVEYHDSNGVTQSTADVEWHDAYVIPADHIIGDSPIALIINWLVGNLIGLAGLVLGIPTFIATVRVNPQSRAGGTPTTPNPPGTSVA